VQNIGTKSADVLRLTGARVETIERCSAVDGTWGMKKEYFELSMKLAQPLFKEVEAARPDRVATDCPLAALQINQGTGREAQHPIRILAEAYGLSIEA
jgi:Fe-S oxidoreductase